MRVFWKSPETYGGYSKVRIDSEVHNRKKEKMSFDCFRRTSFIISELRTAFTIGFLIYIPFVVIDMVVASVLMSMGMMMLPPTTISLPFKILLFILADGWSLIIGSLVKTFY